MIFNDFCHYLNSWLCAVLRIFTSSLFTLHSDPSQSLYLQCPVFYSLCEDSVWGVRKACADVFMPVSCVCSPQVRSQELSPLFINLLRDQSRWVRMAAFQALGPFISTFADPGITALLHNENGEIVITDTEQLVNRMIKIEEERAATEQISAEEEAVEAVEAVEEERATETVSSQKDQSPVEEEEKKEEKEEEVNMDTDEDSWEAQLVSGLSESTSPEEVRAERFLSSVENYSSFLYWREPVASLELADVDLALSKRDNDNLDSLPDQLLKLNLNSTQNETKEETDFSTDVLPDKTEDDVTGDCDRKPGVSGKSLHDNCWSDVNVVPLCTQVTSNCGIPSPSLVSKSSTTSQVQSRAQLGQEI